MLGADLDEDPYVDMQVAAVLVYDRALDPTEQQQTLEYLQTQFGLVPNGAPAVANNTILPNVGPSAVGDQVQLSLAGSLDIDVKDNDTDDNNALDPSSVTVITGPTAGSVLVNEVTGEVTYTHDGSGVSTDFFTYTIADETGLVSNVAMVDISIDTNTPPESFPDIASLFSSDSILVNVLANDIDDNDQIDESSVMIVTQPQHGELTIQPDGSIEYVHGGDNTASDTFGYVVSDEEGQPSSEAIVSLTILANERPVANNDAATVIEGESVMIDVLLNDTDDNNALDPTSLIIVDGPSEGTLSIDPLTGVVTYTHSGSDVQADAFSYSAGDETGLVSVPANVTITIDADISPVAEADFVNVEAGSEIDIDVLSNDDVVLNTVSVMIQSEPSHGSVSVNGQNGILTYTHSGNAALSDSLTYVVSDSAGNLSEPALVSITIEPFVLPVDGLVAHFSSEADLTESANTVVSWSDMIDGSHTLVSSGDPTLIPNALNGFAVVDFDGVDDSMTSILDPVTLSTGANDRTVFYVVSYEGLGQGGLSHGADLPNEAFSLIIDDTVGLLGVTGSGSGNTFLSSSFGTGAGWIIHSGVVDDNLLTIYSDDQEIASVTHEFSTVPGPVVLGSSITAPPFVDMQVAEILIYDRALDAAEQEDVRGYLRNKYDLDNN